MLEVLIPFAMIESGAAVIVDVAADADGVAATKRISSIEKTAFAPPAVIAIAVNGVVAS